MRGLDIHKNIPDSVIKLSLGLPVSFISSHLTTDKLFSVNPRVITGPPKMCLLLETKNMPALIVRPRLILVVYTDDISWYITSNQQEQMFVQHRKPQQDFQQSKCYSRADLVLHHRLYLN